MPAEGEARTSGRAKKPGGMAGGRPRRRAKPGGRIRRTGAATAVGGAARPSGRATQPKGSGAAEREVAEKTEGRPKAEGPTRREGPTRGKAATYNMGLGVGRKAEFRPAGTGARANAFCRIATGEQGKGGKSPGGATARCCAVLVGAPTGRSPFCCEATWRDSAKMGAHGGLPPMRGGFCVGRKAEQKGGRAGPLFGGARLRGGNAPITASLCRGGVAAEGAGVAVASRGEPP